MSRRNAQFSSVRTEGGLLPQDVLSRIQAGDKDLPGLTPESYHLGPHERIGEAVNPRVESPDRRLAGAPGSPRQGVGCCEGNGTDA